MLSRFLSRPLRFHSLALTLVSSSSSYTTATLSPPPPSPPSPTPHCSLRNLSRRSLPFLEPSRAFSSSNRRDGGGGGDDGGAWKFTPEANDVDSVFGKPEEGGLSGIAADGGGDVGAVPVVVSGSVNGGDSWSEDAPEKGEGDIFEEIDREFKSKTDGGGGGDEEWTTAKGYEPWGFGDEGEEKGEELEKEKTEEKLRLEKEEEELSATLKGPNRAFGDLIAASGITEEMLDGLILLKDLKGVEGLPSLREIEDICLAKDAAPSIRAEVERKKQEELAKARVRQVDEKGRAYGTGRRKCSIARVWIQPGDGKFIVNDKQFDAYFPIIDHRADLLRPFTETKTLGLWDVNCTVKGGGVSGQVGAVRLGISRALQNWEPGLRQYLRSVGFLTRDSRVVERKKPGKAKARKSFQWVKR